MWWAHVCGSKICVDDRCGTWEDACEEAAKGRQPIGVTGQNCSCGKARCRSRHTHQPKHWVPALRTPFLNTSEQILLTNKWTPFLQAVSDMGKRTLASHNQRSSSGWLLHPSLTTITETGMQVDVSLGMQGCQHSECCKAGGHILNREQEHLEGCLD